MLLCVVNLLDNLEQKVGIGHMQLCDKYAKLLIVSSLGKDRCFAKETFVLIFTYIEIFN